MMLDLKFPLKACFLAVPLEGNAKARFAVLQEALGPWEEILRLQNPSSPHLTLQYWPTVMEIEYEQILRQSEAVAAKAVPFRLKILGADTFGSRGEDRVLFLAVPFSDPLARLRKLCPWPQEKPFSPHVTIARIRHPQRFAIEKKRIMKIFKGVEFDLIVDRIRLYAEVDGVKQAALQDYPFAQV